MTRFAKGTQPWHLEVHFVQPHDPYLPLKTVSGPLRSAVDSGAEEFRRHVCRASPACTAANPRPGARLPKTTCGRAARTTTHTQSSWTRRSDGSWRRSTKPARRINTLVAFTADHGDMVGAHRMWIKGWIPYEECYRVPMIVRWPGKTQAGSTTAHLVQTHDLAHTYVSRRGRADTAVRRRRVFASPLGKSASEAAGATRSSAPIMAASSCTPSGSPSQIASSTCSTASVSTNVRSGTRPG